MRKTNRGDIPAPHVARNEEKAVADPAEDVVFDAGSLSFVQDWVEGADGADATTEGELDRQDPRQSNPNRRLGVGAQPKKPKQERVRSLNSLTYNQLQSLMADVRAKRTTTLLNSLKNSRSTPEPNALEKKLLRKRQRQELSDAIAGEMGSHGVTDSIGGEEGESKTASFKAKKKKKRERKQPASLPEEDARPGVAGGDKKKALQEDGGAASGGGEGEAAKDVGDGDEGAGEKYGRKRKTKRKKRKAATEEIGEGAGDGAEIPQLSAAAAAAATAAAEGNPPAEAAAEQADGESPEDPEHGIKKQRRGWGKARSKPAAPAGSEGVEIGNATVEGAARERRSRKKTRSKQKNIRKDKRPAGERPAYLRAGDPEFCGRGLTDETRKFLGLPQDGFDNAPPAGWGQPGKTGVSPKPWVNPGWVVDKKPLLNQERSVSHNEGDGGEEPDSGVAVDPKRKVGREPQAKGSPPGSVDLRRKVAPVVGSQPLGKSKYKNLALPPGKKSKAGRVGAKRHRRSLAEGQVEKQESEMKTDG